MSCFREGVATAANRAQKTAPDMLNPLVLAYVGDAAFELFVRTALIDAHDAKAHALHVMSSKRVCAASQARAATAIFDRLTDVEKAVFARGKNAKPGTIPKNAHPLDYALATALEAVIGYVYLTGDETRLMELMRGIMDSEGIVDHAKPKPYKG